MNHKAFLTGLFEAAVAAADPFVALPAHLPEPPKGRTIVVGAGKGAAQLARAFEQMWPHPLAGVVVTRYGYAVPCQHVRILEASHPVPDAAGLEASSALLSAVSNLSEEDLVVALVCGGGSALLPAPPAGVSLEDEQQLNRSLLTSGAPISAMNAIRKHVSRIKGGRLAAAAYPAKVVSLVVSDVPGDDPAQVASGPTVPNLTTRADAQSMIKNYRIDVPASILDHLKSDAASAPDPGHRVFTKNEIKIIASAGLSLDAAVTRAKEQGIAAVVLSDAIEGEAREVAKEHAAIAREVSLQDRPFQRPVVILSGGRNDGYCSRQRQGRQKQRISFSPCVRARWAEKRVCPCGRH